MISLRALKEKIQNNNSNDDVENDVNDIARMLDEFETQKNPFTRLEVDEWIDADEELLPVTVSDDSGDDDIVTNPREKNVVKHQDAINSFNVCLQWAEENNVELAALISLRNLREAAVLENQKKIRQTELTDFFTRE